MEESEGLWANQVDTVELLSRSKTLSRIQKETQLTLLRNGCAGGSQQISGLLAS